MTAEAAHTMIQVLCDNADRFAAWAIQYREHGNDDGAAEYADKASRMARLMQRKRAEFIAAGMLTEEQAHRITHCRDVAPIYAEVQREYARAYT